jgi:8-amino-7-oxononanoate synthase
LAATFRTQRALLFSSGYSANLWCLLGSGDDIEWTLQDKLNHASLIDGNRLIGLPVKRYLHNNIGSLETKLKKQNGKGLVVTDHVFSMDAIKADLDQIDAIIDKPNTLLMQDDAHGFGVF